MPDKKCPRCGLWSVGSALRCDCGYDFEKGTVEETYYKTELPKDIKTFFIFIVVLNLVAGISSFVTGMNTDNFISLAIIVVWSILVYWLYYQLVQKKNWARILLVVLTFPLGLFLLMSNDVKLYMLQSR